MDEITMLRREQQRIAERIETLQGKLPNNNEMSQIAAFADKTDDVFRALGQVGARGPLPGEGVDAYMRRVLKDLLPYTENTQLNIDSLPSAAIRDFFADKIIDEARARANDKTWGGPNGGVLRKIIRSKASDGGPQITEWAGDPMAWMGQFMGPKQYVKDIVYGNDHPQAGRSMLDHKFPDQRRK